MGGNIKFKTDFGIQQGRRYQSNEYHELVTEVTEFIEKYTGCSRNWIVEIPAYTNKQSFGDMDLIICSDEVSNSNWKKDLLNAGIPVVSNSNCHSILYRELQVDLIFTERKYFWSSVNYFKYNDLGNIIGRQLHRIGLKWGHKGLSIVIRPVSDLVHENNHIIKEIELETDGNKSWFKVCEILGLDPLFEPKELIDIFGFAASAKFFDPEIYQLDNRNATSRVRDRKRKTYHEFLEWIEQTNPVPKYDFPDKDERGGYNLRYPFYQDIILKHWPWVEQEVNKVIAAHERDKKFAKYYNGEEVADITLMTGKELGQFMQYMKPVVKSEEFKEFVVGLRERGKTGEEIEDFITNIIRAFDSVYR